MSASKMTNIEQRATFALSGVLSLRMLGLFMLLPVFTVSAQHLTGATPTFIGIAMGIYGLTQASLQIPFGFLSDHLGRKKIIVFGLFIFMMGSIIAACSHSIMGVIIGRALQGAGAIGSATLALIADFTSEQQRTKAMAIAGISIGFSFVLAMILGPVLSPFIHLKGIFWLAAGLGGIAIFLLLTAVPQSYTLSWHPDAEPELTQFFSLLKQGELLRLNIGIFILHAVLTASFVVLPISLETFTHINHAEQWKVFLPALIFAFVLVIPAIMLAEKKQAIKSFFLGAIALLGCSEYLFYLFAKNVLLSTLSLLLFFTAFSILEAFLPSLVSRTAPAARKGTALGIYSCSQFLGIFIGGLLSGWIYGKLGLTAVYVLCMIFIMVWFIVTPKAEMRA